MPTVDLAAVAQILKTILVITIGIALVVALIAAIGTTVTAVATIAYRAGDYLQTVAVHQNEDDAPYAAKDVMNTLVGAWLSGSDTEDAQNAGQLSWATALQSLAFAPALFGAIMAWRWYRSLTVSS